MVQDLRRKAARLISSKCALAARVDAFHESGDGSTGRNFREDVERKLDRLQEPPPVKAIKPLAAPLEAPRKKRGGKRVRRMKEKYAQTEMRKQANRMTFGEVSRCCMFEKKFVPTHFLFPIVDRGRCLSRRFGLHTWHDGQGWTRAYSRPYN